MDYWTLYNDIVNSPELIYSVLRIILLIVLVYLLLCLVCFNIYKRTKVDKYIKTNGKRRAIRDYISDSMDVYTVRTKDVNELLDESFNRIDKALGDTTENEYIKDIKGIGIKKIILNSNVINKPLTVDDFDKCIKDMGCPFDEEATKGNDKDMYKAGIDPYQPVVSSDIKPTNNSCSTNMFRMINGKIIR